MSTTDTVLLIVLTSLLSAFTLLGIGIAFVVLSVLRDVKRVVNRAEDMIESVESAADVLRNTEGRMAAFKLVRNIVKLVEKGRK